MPHTVNRQGLPGCCKASVLYDLGGDRGLSMPTKRAFIAEIKRKIKLAKADYQVVLICTTTTNQPLIEEWLKEFGFKSSKDLEYRFWQDKKLHLWWYPLWPAAEAVEDRSPKV